MIPVSRTLMSFDDIKIYTEVIENGSNTWIIATHGIGEYSKRHEYLQKIFGNDVNVFQYDLRGHGRSGGKKAYVETFDHFMQDLKCCILYLEKKYNMKDYILFGHSMGALITCGLGNNYLDKKMSSPIGVILSAPPVGIGGALGEVANRLPNSLIRKAAAFKLSVPLAGMISLSCLSYKKSVIDDYLSDPLNHIKIHTKLLFEMLKYSREIFSTPLGFKCKSFCFYGTGDKIISISKLEDYFTNIEKNFFIFPIKDAKHEIHNELDIYKKKYFEYLRKTVNEIIFPTN